MSIRLSASPVAECLKCVRSHQMMSRMFPAIDAAAIDASSGPPAGPLMSTASVSQKLMLAHHLIQSASPGTFYLLPVMVRSLEKLHRLIDIEMQTIGAQKIAMPCLAPQQIWTASDRWNKMGSELFKLTDRSGTGHCLAPTHEEAVTGLVGAESPISVSRLPLKLYQIGRKFRDECRPKHGLLRCREFEMKDLYTFDADEMGAEETYRQVCDSYAILLNKLGLPFVSVEASTGAMGGHKSQEYHLISPVGEDVLFYCEKCRKGFNQEIDESERKCSCAERSQSHKQKSGIEVAHAFILGTLYSKVFNAFYIDKVQAKKSLFMGCFGIGVTRLLAASIEVLSTTEQLRWSSLLAPYQICIIPQKEGYKSDVTTTMAHDLYDQLTSLPHLQSEVVIDDRLHLSIGHRVHRNKAAGYPHIIILGKKALETNALLEHIDVNAATTNYQSIAQIVDALSSLKTVRLL